ncbi:phosphotransferase [Paenibacillus sp.]|jgi:aminoglycoside phosphotransferase (APT) family kinase protein|uniref:phosphotransferase family protein n=1 Tax=Paenibacillus sp. TaxID=58172 RepID=UPI00283AA89C|nr:phosphotransferase [Paenibacillus sp.]
MEWVQQLLAASEQVFQSLSSPTFVMGDFKADNLLVKQGGDGWEISGIFDFTTGYFGDGIADLPRIVAMYLDEGKEELAKLFIRSYFHCTEEKDGFVERFRIHMLHQRILDWGCAKATHDVTWDQELSFSCWAEKYTESATYLASSLH